MSAGRVEDSMVHLTPGDARTTHGAGVKYARALAGAPTGAFLEALIEQEGLIVRSAIGAGFGARRARTAAREFKAAAEAEWNRIATAGGGPVGR